VVAMTIGKSERFIRSPWFVYIATVRRCKLDFPDLNQSGVK
jgi:hypothetical protein